EDVVRAATIRWMRGEEASGGQLHPGFSLWDRRVVPLRHLGEEDAGQRFGCEAESLDACQVEGRDDGAEHGREMQDRDLGRRELLVGHRAVGGAEVDRALGDLPDATPAANRLVVDLEVGEVRVKLVDPLGVDRVGGGLYCTP